MKRGRAAAVNCSCRTSDVDVLPGPSILGTGDKHSGRNDGGNKSQAKKKRSQPPFAQMSEVCHLRNDRK